jgi:hypothetical protein
MDLGLQLTDGELEHGSFQAMAQTKLNFAPSTARSLMLIARHDVLRKRQHVDVLPNSWGTLVIQARTCGR